MVRLVKRRRTDETPRTINGAVGSPQRAIAAAARASWNDVLMRTMIVRDLSTVICAGETPSRMLKKA
jgi:hypothetical protein